MASYDGLFELALSAPDVAQSPNKEELPGALWEDIMKALTQATTGCDQFRTTEGKALEKKLAEYAANIASALRAVEGLDSNRIDKIRQRIKKGITDFFGAEGFD